MVNYWAQNLLLNDVDGRSLCNKQGSFSSVAGVDFFGFVLGVFPSCVFGCCDC